jgi:hypothetical protein
MTKSSKIINIWLWGQILQRFRGYFPRNGSNTKLHVVNPLLLSQIPVHGCVALLGAGWAYLCDEAGNIQHSFIQLSGTFYGLPVNVILCYKRVRLWLHYVLNTDRKSQKSQKDTSVILYIHWKKHVTNPVKVYNMGSSLHLLMGEVYTQQWKELLAIIFEVINKLIQLSSLSPDQIV